MKDYEGKKNLSIWVFITDTQMFLFILSVVKKRYRFNIKGKEQVTLTNILAVELRALLGLQ